MYVYHISLMYHYVAIKAVLLLYKVYWLARWKQWENMDCGWYGFKKIYLQKYLLWASHFLERSTYKKNAIYLMIKQTKSIESPEIHRLKEENCLLKALLLVKNTENSLGRQMYVTNSTMFVSLFWTPTHMFLVCLCQKLSAVISLAVLAEGLKIWREINCKLRSFDGTSL